MFENTLNILKRLFSKGKAPEEKLTEYQMYLDKKSKIEGEVSALIKSFDENESAYGEIFNTVDSYIEKGVDGSKTMKDSLQVRYLKKKEELLKSMGEKKRELVEVTSKLIELQKASSKKVFGDCIVTDRYGRVLLLLRKQDSEFEPNKWGLPGGHVEQNETPEQGAIRELVEETGLSSKEHTLERVMEKDNCTIHYYRVKPEECISMISLDDEEHSNYCFMSIDELRLRPDSDFIKDSRHTILSILDPMYSHFQVIESAHSEGLVTDSDYKKAVQEYKSIKI